MNMKRFPIQLALTTFIINLHACVVVPKKVAVYDQKCKVAVQRIALDVEDIGGDRSWSCTNEYCAWDISAEVAEVAFTTATTTIVSGSIALAGNAAYWLENGGGCPANEPMSNQGGSQTDSQTDGQTPSEQPNKNNTEYVIEEEIVSAKL